METERETIKTFIGRMRIKFTRERISSRPDRMDDEWDRSATHWRCVFKRAGKSLTVYYSQGSAHTEAPKAEDVLDCILSDAESWDNARGVGECSPNVDAFAREFGYDQVDPKGPGLMEQARKVERIFKECAKAFRDLSRLLGETGFAELRECERL